MTTQQTDEIELREDTLRKLAETVREDKLRRTVEKLASFPTRHTHSEYLPKAARWIGSRFWKRGYDNTVSMVPYRHREYRRLNVLCRKRGTDPLAPVRIVCAHFDSRTHDEDDYRSAAPGANDNATGVAVLLELARLLQPVRLPYPIEFLATSGEEQDYWGARAYANQVHRNHVQLDFVLNLDEIGCPNKRREVIVEHDTTRHNRSNNRPSLRLARRVAETAEKELGIPSRHRAIDRSDYMPFEELGYVAIGLFESGRYGREHSSLDIPHYVDFPYVADVTRVALAALLDPRPAGAASTAQNRRPGRHSAGAGGGSSKGAAATPRRRPSHSTSARIAT
jgi:hypothetical protein